MKMLVSVMFAAGAIVLISATAVSQERDVPIADVPAAVLAAAQAAVPGLAISEAEVEVEDGRDVYEIEGTADGVEYEIEITADGEVLEIEADD
jgi:uncharacterized membrane protein YkoI